jgi:hypothetical protein
MANNWTANTAGGVITFSSTDIGAGVEAGNIRICDATAANFMPTADAASRKLFAAITDGTNTATVKAASTAALTTDTAIVVRPLMPTDGTNTQPSMDAAGRAGFFKLTDGTNTAKTMDTAGRAGFQQITDGTNAIGVQQFHNTDNQALGTFYGIGTGGIPQVLNVNGNLDRSKGYQGDQLPGTGIPLDLSMTAQILPPTFATGSVTAGATKTILIPSTTGIKVGTVVQIELGTNAAVEWARVNTVNAGVSIVVDNLANNHTQPFAVFPVQFNAPRDASGEQDLAGGVGATLAVDYNFDGANYQRARNAFGLFGYSDTSVTSVAAGNNVTITTAGTPPTLAAGQTIPVLIYDQDNSKQELAVAIATNPGGKTITFQTLANAYNGSGAHALQVRAPIQTVRGSDPVNFGGWGLAADLAVVYSGQDANGMMQFTVERDVNAVGAAPTQGAASAAGMDADVTYGWYQTTIPNLSNGKLSPLLIDGQGVLVTTAPTQSAWSLTNTSAANGQATASKAAGAANIRHVCTMISGQLVGDATGNADFAIINLRDGATGAGTVLASFRVALATGANGVGTPFTLNGFWVGTAATAMTIEMSAAGATHTIGIVNATGYDTRTA